MNSTTKFLAIFSSLFLLAACETPGGADGANGGNGTGSEAIVPGTQSELERNVGDRVFFDYDSSSLSAEAQQTLERQATWLKTYPNVGVVVEGHCDERGTREYNLALGERRANAAKNYLLSLGVEAARVSTISYGKERPAVVGSDESSWSQNRRAVTVVTTQ